MSGAQEAAPGGPEHRGTVLVVDDCTTIRTRVREILEAANYRVHTAGDGVAGLDEARRVRPDVILVDFVMPRMNGYQFCQQVRKQEELKSVPVVLMSVKADRIGDQFVRHGLADDALSKPFQPAALRAVLEHSMTKPSGRAEREFVVEEPPPATPSQAPAAPEERQRQALDEALERTRGLLLARCLPPLVRRLSLGGGEQEEARLALLEGIGESTLRELVPALAGIDPHAGLPSFSGAIEALPIGEVFQMVALQNLTGVMEIEGPGLTARVFLSKGRIDLSRLDGGDGNFRLGKYIVQQDLASPQEIDRLAEQPDGSGAPLGERLIRLGLIGRDDLHQALQRQASDIFYEVLRWTQGVYRFRPKVQPAEASTAALAIPVGGLLMEGYRRVDEWRLIEREIRSFDEVYQQDAAAIADLDPGALATEETLVLDHVTGSAPVSEIVRSLRLDSFEVCRILFRLLSMKLIRRRKTTGGGEGE
ncbi:MAG: response regulator [Deltaproteobacteria bacterium]|nr:response regulator [Deltaproteobacteria bacterium]